jgi:AcrR family transcriptional regulator
MEDVNPETKVTYRQKQAQATRNIIIEAAAALFLEQGYICSTIEIIAERAGVATSTVYAIFGSKRGILRAIRDAWHEQTHIREVINNSEPSLTAEHRLDQLAAATRRQWEMGAKVIAIYKGAAAADPRAAAELTQALSGRKEGFNNFTRMLQPDLKAGLSVDDAAAILQALCVPEVFDELVRHSGWSMDEYEAWLGRAIKHELLGT